MDRERYEELVRAWGARAYGAARRVCGRDDLAEDAVQEAFLALWRGRAEPGPDEDAGAWLVWQAARRAATSRRGDRRRRKREEVHAMDRVMDRGAGGRDEPAHDVVRREEAEALELELANLPPDERESLALRFAGGATYAALGEVLGVAEATAHDRVRRGLERLRRALAGAGFAAFAGGLERHLARAVPSAPRGLETRLAALASGRAAAVPGALVATRWLVAAAVLSLGGWLGLRALADPPGATRAAAFDLPTDAVRELATDPTIESARPADPIAATTRVPAGASGAALGVPGAQDAAPARAVGWVVDENGVPISAATVTLVSVETQGKRLRFSAAAASSDDGRFTIAVELPADARQGRAPASLRIAHHEAVVGAAPVRMLVAGEETDWGNVTLGRALVGEAGAYALDLLLVDASGAPVPGVEASVEHVSFPDEVVPPELDRVALERARFGEESRGTSDAFGYVRLAGERSGPKRFRLRAADGAWAPMDWVWRVGPGEGVHRVALEPPLACLVHVSDLAGRPLEAQVYFVRAGVLDRWIHGEIASDGRFRVAGLGRGAHLLRVDAEGYSPVRRWIEVVDPEQELALALKRADDPREVGDHAAELHGRVVHARDGAPLAVSPGAVEVFSLWEELPEDLDVARDFLPNHVDPPPVQRMAIGEPPPDSHEFHRTGFVGGTYLLFVRPQGFGRATLGPIRLSPEEVVADLEVALSGPGELEVVVDGPRDGTRVLLTGVGPYSEGRAAAADVAVREADGRGFLPGRPLRERRHVFTDLPAGTTFVAWVLHPGREPAPSLPVLVREGERVRVELQPGRSR